MRAYLIRRLLQGLLVIWALVTIVFVTFRLLPTDPIAMLVDEGMPPEVRARLLTEFGLDRPIWSQYWIYLANLAAANLGRSFFFNQPVAGILAEALVNSLVIIVPAVLIGSTIGTLLGAYLGWARRNSFAERFGVLLATVVRGSPSFVIGVLLLLMLSFWTGWFPVGGMRAPGVFPEGFVDTFLNRDFLWHAFLPILALTITYIPETLLIMRTSMLETRGEDYLDLVRAKGASDRRVMYHAARNSLLPVTTWVLISVGNSIAGIVVIETVFSWPGIGRELALSVTRLDYPVAQAAFLAIAVTVVVLNIVTDLLYAYIDPRVVYS